MQPLISVIIPVFNQEKLLQLTLASLVKQTYKNLEVIVVDDGSDIPLQGEEGFPFSIQFFRQENKGAPAARNKGFALSKGEYVIFWDADIVGKPDMIEKMFLALQENSVASYAYSHFYFGRKKMPAVFFDPDLLKKINYITTTSLIRRQDFSGFDESLKRFQDWDLWLTMLERGKRGVLVDEYLFFVQPGGTMSSWLPSCAYKKPWRYLPWWSKKVEKYEEAKRILLQKHLL